MKFSDNGLVVKDLRKAIDNNVILKNITFSVQDGQILAIVGDSGSGKTTLLKTINRMIEIDRGEILLNNRSIKDMDPIALRRSACMMLQTPTMLDGTVQDNIEFGLKLRGDLISQRSKIIQAIKDAGLPKKFLSKDAAKLSGGEQQRVSLARLMVLEPKVLLLDEPTAALDQKLIRTIEETILNLCKKRNLIILWVTHDHNQARRVGDQLGILKNGELHILSKSYIQKKARQKQKRPKTGTRTALGHETVKNESNKKPTGVVI